ncbi:hypothetical protein ACNS7O_02780 [Haloferacaceae archaeon DSL9]
MSIPPEPDDDLFDVDPSTDPRPYGTVVAEAMAIWGLSKPEAETLVDEAGLGVIDARITEHWVARSRCGRRPERHSDAHPG